MGFVENSFSVAGWIDGQIWDEAGSVKWSESYLNDQEKRLGLWDQSLFYPPELLYQSLFHLPLSDKSLISQ